MSAFDRLVRHGLPLVPKPIVGYFARPYVAGASLDDAVATIRALNAEGAMATVDVLGEEVAESAKAENAVEEYTRLLQRIAEERIDTNVSIKPTLLGLKVDEVKARIAEYETAWAKRMKSTPESKKWSAKFDPLVVPGSMGYEVYELLEG